jgi:restriction endonuclease S subunit
MADAFWNDLKSELNPKGDGFISSIVHDDTFRDISGSVGSILSNSFKNISNLTSSFQKAAISIVDGLGGLFSGVGLYMIIAVVGIGAVAYAYNVYKK